MNLIASYILELITLVLAVPVAVFAIEIISATTLARPTQATTPDHRRPRVAVLVPAHNEGDGLLLTLRGIKTQLVVGDRLLVVADNCDDNTKDVALSQGAEVIDRKDLSKVGKGYALDYGVRHLALDQPDVVIVIDADCRIAPGTIGILAAQCSNLNRPVQAHYIMTAEPGSEEKFLVAEFAWRIKNWVRPIGLSALGFPCQLMGTGMAFPWSAIRSVDLANGFIVEDLKLGLDLALLGQAPVFCDEARVFSFFPTSSEGVQSQRRRWEHGHISLIVKAVPTLVWKAIVRRDKSLLAMALDLLVPPISFLALLSIALLFAAGLAALFGMPANAFIFSAANLFVLSLVLLLSWLKFGNEISPFEAIGSFAAYVKSKLRIYLELVQGRTTARWIRTERKKL